MKQVYLSYQSGSHYATPYGDLYLMLSFFKFKIFLYRRRRCRPYYFQASSLKARA